MHYTLPDKNKQSHEDQPQLQLEIYPIEWYYESHTYEPEMHMPSSYEVDFEIKEIDLRQDDTCKRVIIIDM